MYIIGALCAFAVVLFGFTVGLGALLRARRARMRIFDPLPYRDVDAEIRGAAERRARLNTKLGV